MQRTACSMHRAAVAAGGCGDSLDVRRGGGQQAHAVQAAARRRVVQRQCTARHAGRACAALRAPRPHPAPAQTHLIHSHLNCCYYTYVYLHY